LSIDFSETLNECAAGLICAATSWYFQGGGKIIVPCCFAKQLNTFLKMSRMAVARLPPWCATNI